MFTIDPSDPIMKYSVCIYTKANAFDLDVLRYSLTSSLLERANRGRWRPSKLKALPLEITLEGLLALSNIYPLPECYQLPRIVIASVCFQAHFFLIWVDQNLRQDLLHSCVVSDSQSAYLVHYLFELSIEGFEFSVELAVVAGVPSD